MGIWEYGDKGGNKTQTYVIETMRKCIYIYVEIYISISLVLSLFRMREVRREYPSRVGEKVGGKENNVPGKNDRGGGFVAHGQFSLFFFFLFSSLLLFLLTSLNRVEKERKKKKKIQIPILNRDIGRIGIRKVGVYKYTKVYNGRKQTNKPDQGISMQKKKKIKKEQKDRKEKRSFFSSSKYKYLFHLLYLLGSLGISFVCDLFFFFFDTSAAQTKMPNLFFFAIHTTLLIHPDSIHSNRTL